MDYVFELIFLFITTLRDYLSQVSASPCVIGQLDFNLWF